ncbi:MAG: response regulator, partial [Marmoricola sp.]
MIRVLVVDDHPVVRSGLVGVLSSLGGFEVVGVAADGHKAVREAVLHHPDVALMDLRMPGTDGFTAIREIARVAPAVRICVLTMYDDDDSLFA